MSAIVEYSFSGGDLLGRIRVNMGREAKPVGRYEIIGSALQRGSITATQASELRAEVRAWKAEGIRQQRKKKTVKRKDRPK